MVNGKAYGVGEVGGGDGGVVGIGDGGVEGVAGSHARVVVRVTRHPSATHVPASARPQLVEAVLASNPRCNHPPSVAWGPSTLPTSR